MQFLPSKFAFFYQPSPREIKKNTHLREVAHSTPTTQFAEKIFHNRTKQSAR